MGATVLVLVESVNEYLPILEEQGHELILAPNPETRERLAQENASRITAVLTRGPLGLRADEMDRLPNLGIICVLGAGYEEVDLAAARERGIAVTNGAGVNASTVADHAVALLLGVVRDLANCDASVRRHEWRKVNRPTLAGKRLGIIGLGATGLEIARRGALGFGMQVGYHNRRAREDAPSYTYFDTPQALAQASDFLIVATPGGADTRCLVDASVLEALGPEGFLVNIARGSVVDTEALISALRAEKLAGAALDVFDNEPQVPDALKQLPNVLLTPHVAGLSPQASEDTVRKVADNLAAFLAGEPLLTPVH